MNPRRLAVIASACGLLLAGAAPALATPSATSGKSEAQRKGGTSPVRIVTYNTEYGRSPGNVVADIKNLIAIRADVIGLQEMGSPARRQGVRTHVTDCATCTYDGFMPNTPEQNAVPILYNTKKFSLLESGGTKVSERTNVGASGAGPSTLKAKWVNWVRLYQYKTGKSMYFLNNHAVPSVQGGGGGRNKRHPARLKLYRQHMNGLKAMVTSFAATGDPVFTTGDFNVNYRRDVIVRDSLFPVRNMGQVGVHASYQFLGTPETGTHSLGRGKGTRLIDYVSALTHSSVFPRQQDILMGYGSDHRPVMVRYGIAK